MASKTLKTRLKQKRDSSANWNKATNFTPLAGEIIVYSDLNMIKIGDGATKVSALPFLKGNNPVDLSKYVPYTGATKDVDLGKHSLVISNRANNTGNPTIKVSAKVSAEDDICTIISPSGLSMTDLSTTSATLSSNSLAVNDGPYTGAVISSGFKATFDNNTVQYSTYGYDGIDHNGKKLTLPAKAGTIALLSDIPSVSGYVPYSGGTQDVLLKKNNSFVTSYQKNKAYMDPSVVHVENTTNGENNIKYDGMYITDSVGKVVYTRRGITAEGIEFLFPTAIEATSQETNVFVMRSDIQSLQSKLYRHVITIRNDSKSSSFVFTLDTTTEDKFTVETLFREMEGYAVSGTGAFQDNIIDKILFGINYSHASVHLCASFARGGYFDMEAPFEDVFGTETECELDDSFIKPL